MSTDKKVTYLKQAEALEAKATKYKVRRKTALFRWLEAKFHGDEAKVGEFGLHTTLICGLALVFSLWMNLSSLIMAPILLIMLVMLHCCIEPASAAMCLRRADALRHKAANYH